MQLLFGTARAAFYSIKHWRLTLEWNNVLIQSHNVIHISSLLFTSAMRRRWNLNMRRNGEVRKFFKKNKLTFSFSRDKVTL